MTFSDGFEKQTEDSSAVTKAAYRWNSIAGLLSAFQSVFMMAILSRTCSAEAAGIFSLAYANANLFLNLGKYGVRNYQVSDYPAHYEFSSYIKARAVTTAAMLSFGMAYLGYSACTLHYDSEKIATIVLLLLYKTVDCIEDVFYGNYQQHGRLDVGMKFFSIRLASSMMLFFIVAIISHNMLYSLGSATAYSFPFLLYELYAIRHRYDLPKADRGANRSWVKILRNCFPLFLSTFLLFFISNAPKYAIDARLNDEMQAVYGYISMPVFVVNLLSTFIYNPILASLVKDWNERRIKVFKRIFFRQCLIIVGITLICDVLAYGFGTQFLGLLYNADLAECRFDLILLISGGGVMAIATLFTLGVTIIRRQALLSWGYFVTSLYSAISSSALVGALAIRGAALAYVLSMILLAIWFGVAFILGVNSGSTRTDQHAE